MKKTKSKRTGRITAISVSRLYNTGNYTNVKYELSAEVPKGASPGETLRQMVFVLQALRPISRPDCLDQLRRARTKKLSERSEYDKEHYSDWLRIEAEWKKELAEREVAVGLLEALGGTSESRDAKLDWQDADTPW